MLRTDGQCRQRAGRYEGPQSAEIKTLWQKWRMPLRDFSDDWTQLSQEPQTLRSINRTLQSWNIKRIKTGKHRTKYPRTLGQVQECSAFTVGPSQKKGTGYARRKGQSLPQITPDYMSGGSENAKVNAENASPRHIIFKWQKIKGNAQDRAQAVLQRRLLPPSL